MGGEEPRELDAALTSVDREILGFVASQSLVSVNQLRSLLTGKQAETVCEEAEAIGRAGSLVGALLREGPRLRHQAGMYQITRRGLGAIAASCPSHVWICAAIGAIWRQVGLARGPRWSVWPG